MTNLPFFVQLIRDNIRGINPNWNDIFYRGVLGMLMIFVVIAIIYTQSK